MFRISTLGFLGCLGLAYSVWEQKGAILQFQEAKKSADLKGNF